MRPGDTVLLHHCSYVWDSDPSADGTYVESRQIIAPKPDGLQRHERGFVVTVLAEAWEDAIVPVLCEGRVLWTREGNLTGLGMWADDARALEEDE